MAVTVEFLGIVRQKAGVPQLVLEAATLGDLLGAAANACPALRGVCVDESGLRPGFLASLNGQRFTRDGTTPLQDGDRVLLLSADAGG